MRVGAKGCCPLAPSAVRRSTVKVRYFNTESPIHCTQREGHSDPITEDLTQRDGYLNGLGLDNGWLVLFDRRVGQPPIAERTKVEEMRSPDGRCAQVIYAQVIQA